MKYTYEHIQAAGTYVLKTDGGVLHTVTVNTTAAGTITLYDNTSAAGKVIAVLKASIVEQSLVYDLDFSLGLTAVVAAASDVTVTFT